MYFCVVLCIVCFVMFPTLFVCICVLNNCHRVATQLQLNISYYIISCSLVDKYLPFERIYEYFLLSEIQSSWWRYVPPKLLNKKILSTCYKNPAKFHTKRLVTKFSQTFFSFIGHRSRYSFSHSSSVLIATTEVSQCDKSTHNNYYILTQLLTNHGCFRSYLYKTGKVPTSLCNCPEKSEQTARHLILDCSLLWKERPTALQNLTLPQIMKYHINTEDIPRFFQAIFHMLQDQPR
jgi:hypothetical protein